ncbi:Vacuolar protein sorting-associated protein 11-like protein [Diplonema papillatum]|nr:Vacuolar protein sorting-associated protein 11-like protein [Diplonema papillatum]
MALAYWHNFQFFDVELVEGPKKVPVMRDLEILCWTSGRSQLVFGDHEGVVRIFDRGFQCQHFKAYSGMVTHLYQVKTMKVLITVGVDSEDPNPKVKAWSLDRENEQPALLRTLKLFTTTYPAPPAQRLMLNLNPQIDLDYTLREVSGDKKVKQSTFTSPITCIDATEDLQCLALGLTSGDIILCKGHLLREPEKLKQIPLKRVYGKGSPVTQLFFKPENSRAKGAFVLHVLFKDGENMWRINPKGESCEAAPDVPGCAQGCACLSNDGRLIVAQEDTLHFFGGTELEECQQAGLKTPAPNSKTKKVGWFRNYMYTVATMDKIDRDQLTVYDLTNKLKATLSNQCFFPNVVCVLHEWNSIYVLHQVVEPGTNNVNQRLYQLEEKDTQTKLDLLFKKSMFQVAIDLAKAQQFDRSAVTEIYKKFGDYLYNRTDYSRAVQQFIETIGTLEPSYVIRKFLDAQQIHNLTRYLEELHTRRNANDKPLANEDHTTLLLNCYTKLKDEKKLDEFIQEDRDYNPETAIKVLRQAGYFRHALHLAKKFKAHTWFLSIQVEDLQEYDEALSYLHSLDFEEAENQLREYGKVIVGKKPMRATTLLMEICTGWKKQPYGLAGAMPTPAQEYSTGEKPKASPDQFLPCFVDMPHYLMMFLEIVKNDLDHKEGEDGSAMVYNTLLELYLTRNLKQSTAADLTEGEDELDDDYEERKEKALALLRDNKGLYDREHALVLVQTHNFREGILFLYESLELYQDILQYYMEIGDKDEVIKTCERFGKQDPNMWVQVLLWFVGLHEKEEKEDVTLETQKVLKHIDAENLLPPLVVVDILGRSKETKLDTIKDYVVKRLERDMLAIDQDQKEIRELQALTQKYREEIRSQQSEAQIFQFSRCMSCGGGLELPAVHFMCKHSYHQNCLAEPDKCPQCSATFSRILDVNKNLEDTVENHEMFFRQLNQPGRDGFSVVAEYFGRNIFNGEYPPPPDGANVGL